MLIDALSVQDDLKNSYPNFIVFYNLISLNDFHERIN